MKQLQALINEQDIKSELQKLQTQGIDGVQHIEGSYDAYYFTLPICDGFERNPTMELMLELDDSNQKQLKAWCLIDTHETGIMFGGCDLDFFISSDDVLTVDNIINKAHQAITTSSYSEDAIKVKGKFRYEQIKKFAEAVIPIMEMVQAKSVPLAA